jgi:type II secretory pathway pseudopilin PulG
MIVAVSIVAFVLASIADVVLLAQVKRHRKELAANEAAVRMLRQELRNDFDSLRSQVCSVIEFADKEVRADLAEYVGAVKQSILAETRDLYGRAPEPVVAKDIPAPAVVAELVSAEPAVAGHRISGYADCPNADIALAGFLARNTTADDAGNYSFDELPDGTYVVKPSTAKPGKTFLPDIRIIVVAGADVGGVDFIDPSSVVDSRTTPNSSRTVQGTLIYDVPKVDSRVAANIPVDCRVAPNKPVDSRVSPNIPQNSRS